MNIVAQMAMGAYRQAFLDVLAERAVEVTFLTGKAYFDPTVSTDIESPLADVRDRNVYLLGRRIALQRWVIGAAISSSVAVLEFNPRILSNWIVLVLRRLRRRETWLWGHAWSRSGKASRTELIRRTMRRLSSGVAVYTPDDAEDLRRAPDRPLVRTIPNSLYRADDLVAEVSETGDEWIISVSRLIAAKKVDVLIEALALATRSEDRRSPQGLIVVGDGPERQRLVALSRSLGIEDHVEFHGEVTNVSRLRSLYSRTIAAASAGYVGLSATQAAGFGRPLIFGQNEPHAPEVSLLDATNSVPVARGNPNAFAAAYATVMSRPEEWKDKREEISTVVRAQYSAEAMASGLQKLFEDV